MEGGSEERPIFRSAKRRKIFRKRDAEEEGDAIVNPTPQPARATDNSDVEDEIITNTAALSQLIRARRQNKGRGQGVEYSNASLRPVASGTSASSAKIADSEGERLQGISDRFIGYTGQDVDVDKHMIAFIESEMARRHESREDNTNSAYRTGTVEDAEDDKLEAQLTQRHAASLGKLQEIDLGESATLRNLQRTEAAIRRQRGEYVPPEEPLKAKKPRLGRNGKPRRGPQRRNSEDVKRDQLVEQLLRENRLDLYDDPASAAGPSQGTVDEDADERLAEQFRQEFMEAMQSRQQKAPKPGPQKPNQPSDPLRGPKLGGSRSARAAMHKQLEAAAKKT